MNFNELNHPDQKAAEFTKTAVIGVTSSGHRPWSNEEQAESAQDPSGAGPANEGTFVMKRQIVAGAAILALASFSAAFAGDIYKWVDEDGNVHYGDKPVGETSERMDIQSKPTDPARIDALVASRAETRVKRDEERAAAAEAAVEAAEAQAKADELAQKCSEARATMQQYVTARRLYREDDAGERQYLDEQQIQEARQRLEDQIDEHCSS